MQYAKKRLHLWLSIILICGTRGERIEMKEGLYEIVEMRRSNRGKWVFTARPTNSEISFECDSDALEQKLFSHSREKLWLHLNENRECNVLINFEAKGELNDLMRRRTLNPYKASKEESKCKT